MYTPSVYSLYMLGRKNLKINSWTTSFIQRHLFVLRRKRVIFSAMPAFFDAVHHITLHEGEPFQNSLLSALVSSALLPFEDEAKPSQAAVALRWEVGPFCPLGGAAPLMINGLARPGGHERCFIHEGFHLHVAENLVSRNGSCRMLMHSARPRIAALLLKFHLKKWSRLSQRTY